MTETAGQASEARLREERDQLQQELGLLKQELELRNCALDAAASHFMITSASDRSAPIVYVNEALSRDHGYERSELVGKSSEVLVPGDLNPESRREIASAVKSRSGVRTQIRSRRKDGSEFWTRISISPVRGDGDRITHYVSVGEDITASLEEERNKRELQERLLSEMREREKIAIELRMAQKLESVGRLAAGIAHEINTPIQYIGDSIAFLRSADADLKALLDAYRAAVRKLVEGTATSVIQAQLAELESSVELEYLSTEMPKAFERTLEGVERVARIVRALKEFAHPDTAEQSAVDLNHAIETTLAVSRNEYKYCAQVETALGELPLVLCDAGELNQVLLNIVVNAAHAIADAGKDSSTGRIQISSTTQGDNAVICIEDNGCGIPKESLDKIFDPFYTTKPVGRGTGQGLAISRTIIVEKHGGQLKVDSTPGVGTRFSIHLPIAGLAATERST